MGAHWGGAAGAADDGVMQVRASRSCDGGCGRGGGEAWLGCGLTVHRLLAPQSETPAIIHESAKIETYERRSWDIVDASPCMNPIFSSPCVRSEEHDKHEGRLAFFGHEHSAGYNHT